MLSKKYYGGVLLPKIPVIQDCQYAIVCYNSLNRYYQVIYGALPWYVNSGSVYMNSSAKNVSYTLSNNTWVKGSEYNDNGGYGITDTRNPLWTTHDIPNGSPTATDIFMYTSPTNFGGSAFEVTSGTTLTATIEADAGTWILATVAVRSTFTAPSGWTVLHESEQIGSLNHRMIMLCKQCTDSGTVSFTATQETAGRIYINLIACADCGGFVYHSGYELVDNSTETATWIRTRPNFNTIIWCMTKSLWAANLWSCDTLQNSIQLPSTTQPRLCNFIDDSEAVSRTFVSGNTNDIGTVIDLVEVVFYKKKYLIKSGSTLYTIENGSLVALSETTVTSALFSESGFDELPTWSIMSALTNPELMFWNEDDESTLPTITANMTGSPPTPQTILTTSMDIHEALGIQSCTVTYAGSPRIALKFDNGDFEYFNGLTWETAQANDGMTANLMLSISAETWTAKFQNHSSLTIRVILDTINDKISLIRFKFVT